MSKKTVALLLALLISTLALSACGGESEATPVLDTATDAIDTASPSLAPSPSPTQSATPAAATATAEPPSATPKGETETEEIVTNFKDLAKANNVVLRGEFTKKLPDLYNAMRSMDDGTEGDPGIFIEQEQYEFKISEIYGKHDKDTYKVGDTIVINTPLNERYFSGEKPKKSSQYLEMELNQDTVIFLERWDYNPKRAAYYTQAGVYVFTVKDGRMYARSYDDSLLKGWNADEGIPIANLKKDLGIQ